MERREADRLTPAADGGADGGKGCIGLRLVDDALGKRETRSQMRFRPFDDRVPVAILAGDETFGLAGAIKDEIARRVGRDIGPHLADAPLEAVERRVGDARRMHARGLDRLALRPPLDCHDLGRRVAGQGERLAGRACGPAGRRA